MRSTWKTKTYPTDEEELSLKPYQINSEKEGIINLRITTKYKISNKISKMELDSVGVPPARWTNDLKNGNKLDSSSSKQMRVAFSEGG